MTDKAGWSIDLRMTLFDQTWSGPQFLQDNSVIVSGFYLSSPLVYMLYRMPFPSLVVYTRGQDAADDLPSDALIAIFDTLQIFGLLSLTALILTASISSRVRRTSTWYSFILAWIFFCISNLLLLGRQMGPEPGDGICLLQAGLVYAAPPLCAFATLAMMLELYLNVSFILTHNEIYENKFLKIVMHVLPPIVHLTVFIIVIILGTNKPETITRTQSHFFCHLSDGLSTKISATFVIVALAVIIVLQGLCARLMYRNWNAFRRLSARSNENTSASSPIAIMMIVRASIFSVLPVLALGLSLFSISPTFTARLDSILNIIIAVMPGAAGTIFATQPDNLRAWRFWKRKENPVEVESLRRSKYFEGER